MTRTRFRIISRGAIKRLAVLFVLLGAGLLWCWILMIRMPGTSYRGALPALTESQRALSDELKRDVQVIAGDIGKRSVYDTTGLNACVDYLEKSLREAGCQPQRQTFTSLGVQCHNIEVEIPGSDRADEIVIVGAHYDSVDDSPAANDNGSGVAATLALCRRFAPGSLGAVSTAADHIATSPDRHIPKSTSRTLRFVFFVNEEPPFFHTDEMGSLVYAKACRDRGEKIVAMISLETIGYYSDQPGSQKYPFPFALMYPSTGNFIGFVGNIGSRHLVRRCISNFRTHARFPSEGGALPSNLPGVGWSDHWAFWQHGYPALMLTDTAPFRYPHYHTNADTPDKLDYDRMARVVEGVEWVVKDLVDGK